MKTTIDIDDELMAKAKQAGSLKTKKAIVERALELFVAVQSQKKIKELWGKVEIDDTSFN